MQICAKYQHMLSRCSTSYVQCRQHQITAQKFKKYGLMSLFDKRLKKLTIVRKLIIQYAIPKLQIKMSKIRSNLFHITKKTLNLCTIFKRPYRSEKQKKSKRSESGVTENGGAFDILKCFCGNK